MIRRRANYDPLEPTKEPRWYVVQNMHGALVESRPLAIGIDLKRVFVAAMLEWHDAGWQLGEFSSRSGTFFCQSGGDRRQISIMPTNPHELRTHNISHLQSSPRREG